MRISSAALASVSSCLVLSALINGCTLPTGADSGSDEAIAADHRHRDAGTDAAADAGSDAATDAGGAEASDSGPVVDAGPADGGSSNDVIIVTSHGGTDGVESIGTGFYDSPTLYTSQQDLTWTSFCFLGGSNVGDVAVEAVCDQVEATAATLSGVSDVKCTTSTPFEADATYTLTTAAGATYKASVQIPACGAEEANTVVSSSPFSNDVALGAWPNDDENIDTKKCFVGDSASLCANLATNVANFNQPPNEGEDWTQIDNLACSIASDGSASLAYDEDQYHDGNVTSTSHKAESVPACPSLPSK